MKNQDPDDRFGMESAEVRRDIWWITDEYISLALVLVVIQLEEDTTVWTSFDEFRDRVTHVLREHCPVAYSYFFQHTPDDVLPGSFINTVAAETNRRRPGAASYITAPASRIIGMDGHILRPIRNE